MIKLRESLEMFVLNTSTALGFVAGLIPAGIWLFIALELFLFALCNNMQYIEVYVIQFPITLWVLTHKKDAK